MYTNARRVHALSLGACMHLVSMHCGMRNDMSRDSMAHHSEEHRSLTQGTIPPRKRHVQHGMSV